ncbi:hypothetical protein DEU40_105129 [Chryseobacterium sp. AG844]|nr:hypothetical protein DEU40_105129 [Chryseobacterium sp. AG844]
MVQKLFLIYFFCLETKESKIQDLEISAKNEICSLKTLNSCGNDLCLESYFVPHSNNRVFLTFTEFIFLTLQFLMSFDIARNIKASQKL